MPNLQLRIQVGNQEAAKAYINAALVARLNEAVGNVAHQTTAMWQEAVHRARLWVGERDAYANSISWRMTGPTAAVVEASYNLAQEIESGRPSKDLKDMLNTSMKVRTSKDGRRYLIIPFRHNTPGYTAHSDDMPEHVYAMASKLKASKITSMGTRLSGTGASDIKTKQAARVPQAKYLWGGRVGAGSMGPNPKSKVDRFAGMVRFEEKSGKGTKSTYMTFRVMAEGSSGWVVRPRPGQPIAQTVVDAMTPIAQQEIAAAALGVVV